MKYKRLTLKFTISITDANIGLVRRIRANITEKIEVGRDLSITYTINAILNTSFTEDLAKPIIALFNGQDMVNKPMLAINA